VDALLFFKVQAWKEEAASRRLVTLYSSSQQGGPPRHLQREECGANLYSPSSKEELQVSGDVKVVLCHSGFGGHCTEMCSVWFNTKFVKPHETLVFHRGDIDGACKDTKYLRFPADFKVHISLQSVEDSDRFFALTLLQKRKSGVMQSKTVESDVISV